MNDVEYSVFTRIDELICLRAHEGRGVEHMPAAVCKGLIVAELEHNAVVNKVYDLDSRSSVYAVNSRSRHRV